jgi:hypothetical protein
MHSLTRNIIGTEISNILLASGTPVRGFDPGRSRWIFLVWQKSSSMPSFAGEVKYVSHVPTLRHVKEPSNFVNYGLLAKFPGLSSVLR